MTRDQVFAEFQRAVRHVWRNADFVLPHITLDVGQPREKDVLAGVLVVGGKQWAIGNSLLRRAAAYRLRVSDKLLDLPADAVWRVLVHEAVHLGHGGHGKEFRTLCLEKGGVVSGAGVDSGGVIQAQKKVGRRFQTIAEFPLDQEREATSFAKEQAAKARAVGAPERWRLQWA